jgi:hypothetical protein
MGFSRWQILLAVVHSILITVIIVLLLVTDEKIGSIVSLWILSLCIGDFSLHLRIRNLETVIRGLIHAAIKGDLR